MEKDKTIYSVYKEDASRRKLENVLPEFCPNLPCKKFDVIYADPPWAYNAKMQFGYIATEQRGSRMMQPTPVIKWVDSTN